MINGVSSVSFGNRLPNIKKRPYIAPKITLRPKDDVIERPGFLKRVLNFFSPKNETVIDDENKIHLKTDRALGIFPCGHKIMYGGKNVGFVSYQVDITASSTLDEFPLSWFEDFRYVGDTKLRPLKPYLMVTELFMNDRLNKSELVHREKKYGAMAMKELLRIANENGCDDRIALIADKLGKTEFYPGHFYHKMGFSPIPFTNELLRNREINYNLRLKQLKEKGFNEEQINKILADEHLFPPPEMVDGRYLIEKGRMVLTNPECIRDYPL